MGRPALVMILKNFLYIYQRPEIEELFTKTGRELKFREEIKISFWLKENFSEVEQ